MSALACDFCTEPARHIDTKGYVYCDSHKIVGRGRKLTRAELTRLSGGGTIPYTPKPADLEGDIPLFAHLVENAARDQQTPFLGGD